MKGLSRGIFAALFAAAVFFSFGASPAAASGPPGVRAFGSAAGYEASFSSEIRLVRETVAALNSVSRLASPIERVDGLSRLSNLSVAGRAGENTDLARAAELLEIFAGAGGPAGGAVRIVGSRAAVYMGGGFRGAVRSASPAAPAGRFLPAVYFLKSGGAWVLDADYIFKLLKNQTGDLYLDAETFILAEQVWFLIQREEFRSLNDLFGGDFVSGLSQAPSAGREVQKRIEDSLTGAALHFYLCLHDFKLGRYKQAYSHISSCRAMSPGIPVVETVFNMILSQRKFARLIDEKFVETCASDPYNHLALMVAGEYYNIQMRYDMSLVAFETASSLNAYLTPHYHIVRAGTLEKLQKHIEAGDELAKCSAYGPDFYYTGYLAGKKYAEGGDDRKAAAEFEKVIDSLNYAETKREVAYWLMNYHRASGEEAKYYAYRRAYLKSFFNSPTFIGVLIIFWFFYLVRRAAARYFIIPLLKAVSLVYKREWLIDRTFNASCNYGDGEAGVRYYSNYIAGIDKSKGAGAYERAALKLGIYLLSAYRPEEAKKVFGELLAFKPDCGDAILGLGIAEYDLKNIEVALEYFMSAIDAIPENNMPYYYAGICNMLMGAKKEGIELIMISYKIDNTCEPALNLCENYFLSHNLVKELVAFYDDLFVVGDFTEHYIQHYLKLNIARMDSARTARMLEKARKLIVRRPETLLDMSVASRELGRLDDAVTLALKSILFAGGYGWMAGARSRRVLEAAAFGLPVYKGGRLYSQQLLELGIAYRLMGDNASADNAFKRIIRHSPDYPFAHFFLNDFSRSAELMAGELSESNQPWNNASIVEAIYHCLKETNNQNRLDRYREWGRHYARSISDELGIFSYKYLKYIPKTLFLKIINEGDVERI